MYAVMLALSASAGWGTADFLGGSSAKRLPILTVSMVSQAVGFAFTLGLVLTDLHRPDAHTLIFGALAGVAGVVGLMALYAGLAIGPMGVVAPLAAMSGTVPVAVGLFRGERPAPVQLLGVALAIGGVVLAARHRDEAGERASPRAIGLAVIAAVTLGTLVVLLSEAGSTDPAWGVLMLRISALVLLSIAVLVRRPSFAMQRSQLRTLAVVGILDNGSNLLFVLAAQRGLLSLIAVLASLYPVSTVLLARAILKERLSPIQLAGVAATLTGVALIAAG
jgi:drug/metabolite transporter (DMT)-like permease